MGKAEGEAIHPESCVVRFTIYRTRPLDPDNIITKYFLDSLRYCGLIKDDNPWMLTLAPPIQHKVATLEEEKTVIEVFWPARAKT